MNIGSTAESFSASRRISPPALCIRNVRFLKQFGFLGSKVTICRNPRSNGLRLWKSILSQSLIFPNFGIAGFFTLGSFLWIRSREFVRVCALELTEFLVSDTFMSDRWVFLGLRFGHRFLGQGFFLFNASISRIFALMGLLWFRTR